MKKRSLLFLMSFSLSSIASAAVVPAFDLPALVRDADIIVVGRILAVAVQSNTTVTLANGIEVSAKELTATMSVEQFLKGSTINSTLKIRFEAPESSIGYNGVTAGEFSIVFLRNREDAYEFVSPYWPAVPAVPGTLGRGEDALEKVLSILADGLRIDARPEVRIQTLYAMRRIDSPLAIAALESVLSDPDPEIRLTALAFLLSVDQVDALPMAEAALASGPQYDERLLQHLRSGVSSLRSVEAIPSLERLLQSPDAATRRAASDALSHIASPRVARSLQMALDDGDFEVRLNAVRGLANVFDRPNLFPSDDGFRGDEQRFITPLRGLDATQLELP